ncbi:hypothetical protein BDN72DRAFT_169949 [Pluteus cervinus]|uniref:Uncharacterized protein n=1 Tax=Pluteus cervinus TaxID=181527 RepID=A0ACD3AL78_9AGAR|nr:hypothetical protein BDN72DRAFT_169949 [Pluteus cervinus]
MTRTTSTTLFPLPLHVHRKLPRPRSVSRSQQPPLWLSTRNRMISDHRISNCYLDIICTGPWFKRSKLPINQVDLPFEKDPGPGALDLTLLRTRFNLHEIKIKDKISLSLFLLLFMPRSNNLSSIEWFLSPSMHMSNVKLTLTLLPVKRCH